MDTQTHTQSHRERADSKTVKQRGRCGVCLVAQSQPYLWWMLSEGATGWMHSC